ncbi:MAG: lysophospholipid acyltransferase family protein [Planctomycetes bacterium]|nr:lysophospholipid acyltransferase family protein [Planctomycetota bacterium]
MSPPETAVSSPKLRKRFKRWRRRARNWLAGWIGPWLVRGWIGTVRIRWVSEHFIPPDPRGRPNTIYVFWHQRLLGLAYTHRRQGLRVLISSHGDGEMIARVINRLGYLAVRGSSTRGFIQGMRGLLADLGSGRDYGFTPDGPQGPRHVFQPGAVYFASKSGLAIVTLTISYARSWKLPTWDQFVIPRPFTRGLVRCGKPLPIPPNLSAEELEAWRQRLEAELRALTEETDARFEELYRQGRS